jgi:HAMP domain-containing protein
VFRTTHIRTKLALALAVPLLALVAVAGYEVLNATAQVDEAREQAELVDGSLGPGSLVVHLQNERNRAAINLIGLGAAAELAVEDNPQARTFTDPAAEAFRRETDSRGGVVRAAFEPAWAALEDLESLRADIDAYTGPMDSTNVEFADSVFQRYTTIIEAFFDGTSQVALNVDDASLRNGAEIVDATTRQSEMRARIVRDIVQATITGHLDDAPVRQNVAALFDRGRGFDDTIRTNATGPYGGVANETFAEEGVQSFNEQIESYLAGKGVEIGPLLGAVAADPDIGYTGLRAKAAELLDAESDRMQDEAATRQQLFTGIAGAGLLVALLVTWLASRSITRPLRSLRDQAEEMAGTRLPNAVRQILDTPLGEDVVIPEVAPITVKTKDEVSHVAAALSHVQSSAVDLAVEQAVLRRNISDSYINLGRRNQNLLSRQLDFITDLERNETDPDTLEGLFRLDHLATRMRRNAESLLVLAGIDPPRQWAAPVKVADVVRAALGEVEDYQRVVVRNLEPASVTGAVAADVAHVLAELIENGLSFSPPEQSVEVKGRLTTSGYTLAVTDNGFGMAPQDVERANRRLAGKESFTVAPSRYLGHYVAGHLASRLGVVVELQDSPAGGITARIDVPMGLLADEELDRTLARAPEPEPMPEPVVAGPSAAAVSTETTPSGLPRRGERPRPLVAELEAADAVDSEAPLEPVAETPAPETPAPMPAAPAPIEAAPVEAPTVEAEQPWAPPAAPAPVVPMRSEPPAPLVPPTREPVRAAAPPVSPPAPAPVPASTISSLAAVKPVGPSMFSIAAKQARESARETRTTTDDPGTSPGSTYGGLARRVPGAQRPDAAFGSRSPEPVADDPATRTTPEDVYSFLSNFQSGVARGKADAAGDDQSSYQEDGR